jgi:hypothetical protein
LEGAWSYTQLLKSDGSYEYFSETYSFGSGDADGKTYLPFHVQSADSLEGSYLVSKKGDKIYLIYDNTTPLIADTCNIEDMDAKMLVIRSPKGVMYLEKQ